MKTKLKFFTVWLDGSEANDNLLSLDAAQRLAGELKSEGYNEVSIEGWTSYEDYKNNKPGQAVQCE